MGVGHLTDWSLVYPLWDIAIAPVIRAATPTRIVEIGALRGETTTLLLESLGAGVELHVIDPAPEFDPAEHEARFPGQYVFHRSTSHEVLPELGPVDVALIDGDHNWFTVYHELVMLRDAATAAGAPLPVLVMHDVLWPYGRRDLYYAPDRIPAEHRHPYARGGIHMGRSELAPPGFGGVNPTMDNATEEGGPRNGVMTAFEDFAAEHPGSLRTVLLPVYFGLLIAVDEARLAATPGLASALDALETSEKRHELLELSEELRLRALTMQHRYFYDYERRVPALQRRYLDLLKATLLNEPYLENEVRLQYLLDCATGKQPLELDKLDDPRRSLGHRTRRLQAQRQHGEVVASGQPAVWAPHAPIGRARLEHLARCLEQLRTDRVGGPILLCGTSRGGDAAFTAGWIKANDMRRRLFVADPFRGTQATIDGKVDHTGDLNLVRGVLDRYGLLDDQVRFLVGEFTETLPSAPIDKLAMVRVEASDPDVVEQILRAVYDRLVPGGYVVVDGHRSAEAVAAAERFRRDHGIEETLERIDWTGACWRKGAGTPSLGTRRLPVTAPAARPPLAPPSPAGDPVDLSVVVVFYNMRREAERTLHSLSRAYQQGIGDLTYEVIAVENGSAPESKLGADLVHSFGPEFRYVDLGDEATASPVHALNRGMRMARGDAIAFMIDGAHVLTPGVLRFGMLGLRSHEPAMVITQQWYVGPGQQPDTARKGYDQAVEDRLFEQIRWPEDGYELFRIGHFVGDRDWFDGSWESNCLFVPRSVLEQVGGFDEAFTVPGGAYANLEIYERIGSHPGLTVVSILGEGSFHQVHGGTTTNQADVDRRNGELSSYRRFYQDLRGRHFTGHGKPIHFVGAITTDAARRTKARRLFATSTWKAVAGAGTDDGYPTAPIAVPEELHTHYTDTFWHSLDWTGTTWFGHEVGKCPTDLMAYAELVFRLRPRWIIETGTGPGGRALFFASLCELLGHGEVVTIDQEARDGRPTHPRLHQLVGEPLGREVREAVAALVGRRPCALVVLGRDGRDRLVRQFDAYADHVPTGSYVVVEDTIVNGNPVWPAHGPGPAEAVRAIQRRRSDFGVDPLMERYGLTFNRGGYLKRISGGPNGTPVATEGTRGWRKLLERAR